MDFSPNKHTIQAVIASLKSRDTVHFSDGIDIQIYVKSELDNHANMVILGKECFIFESTGKTCNVEPFSSELGIAENIPIVDAALAYDCPFTHETYILIVRNVIDLKSSFPQYKRWD